MSKTIGITPITRLLSTAAVVHAKQKETKDDVL
jgi:hypothetical protein